MTRDLDPGANSVSVPLDPIQPQNVSRLYSAFGATRLQWLDGAGAWTAYAGSGIEGDREVDVSQAYVVTMLVGSRHLFTGEPGAMIDYRGLAGFGPGMRSSLRALVRGTDVDLEFQAPALPGWTFELFVATTRQGVRSAGSRSLLVGFPGAAAPTAETFTDAGALASAGERCYIVSALDPIRAERSSAYSTCVASLRVAGTSGLGPPLRPYSVESVHVIVLRIEGSHGILWMSGTVWIPHFAQMPSGVYDTMWRQAEGYQISVRGPTLAHFTGG